MYLKLIEMFLMIAALSLYGKHSTTADPVLVVGEHFIANNPWRSDIIKRQYEIAIEEAVQEHLKVYPKSKTKVLVSYDDGPEFGFKKAIEFGALGVVGYLYSSDALEASAIAEKNETPYITVRNQSY